MQLGHHSLDNIKSSFLAVLSSFGEVKQIYRFVSMFLNSESAFLTTNISTKLSQGQTTPLSSKLDETFLTVYRSSVNQVLSANEQIVPVLVHHLLDPDPSPKAQILHLPVVEGGPAIAVDKDETDKKDEEVD